MAKTTKSEKMVIKGTGIFAAAYLNTLVQRTLTHACFETDAVVGRLRRAAGQALCSATLNACAAEDACAFEDLAKVDCPKCLAIVARILEVR